MDDLLKITLDLTTLNHIFLDIVFYSLEKCGSILCTIWVFWHIEKRQFLYIKLACECGNGNSIAKTTKIFYRTHKNITISRILHNFVLYIYIYIVMV